MNTSTRLSLVRLWAPWILLGLGAIAVIWNIVALLLRDSSRATMSFLLANAPYSAISLPFALLGALIVTRQRHNRLGWLMLMPTIASFLDVFGSVAVQQAQLTHPTLSAAAILLGLWAETTSWVIGVHPILLILLLFPTGHPSSRRWHLVTLGIIGNTVFTLVLIGLGQHLYSFDKSIQAINPIGVLGDSIVELLYAGVQFAVGILAILCVASLAVRYRRGSLQEKLQIRWIAYAGGIFGVCFVAAVVTLATFGLSWSGDNPLSIAVLVPAGFSLHALPIAIGVAILRHRLFDIDVIIRRTVVYSVVSAVLAVVYFALVAALQYGFRVIIGSESQLAIVASTLAIAALFLPLRLRVQAFIDRRFYHSKYNAEQTLARFNQVMSDAVEMGDITTQLFDAVDNTMQPEKIALWTTHLSHAPIVRREVT